MFKFNILTKKIVPLVLFLIILSLSVFAAVENGENIVSIQEETEGVITETVIGVDEIEEDCIYYFYGQDCQECEESNLFLDDLDEQYSRISLERFEVYHNNENLNLLNQYYESYGVDEENQKVPVVFLSRTYFIGADSIVNFLESRIIENYDSLCPSLEKEDVIGILGEGEPKDIIKTLNFGDTSNIGLQNSFSNSGLSVILLFLILILVLLKEKGVNLKDKKEHLIRNSIAYAASSFFLLLLAGFGMFSLTYFAGKSLTFSRGIALLSLIIGTIIIKRFLFEGQVVSRKYLRKIQPYYQKFLHAITTPLGFMLVAIISTFYTVANWNEGYQVLERLIGDSSLRWQALPLFLWHNIIFLLPLTIIFGLVYWRLIKIENEKEDKVRNHHLKLLRFFIACGLFIISLINLFII